ELAKPAPGLVNCFVLGVTGKAQRLGHDVFGSNAGARVQELGNEADLAPSQKRDVDIRGTSEIDPAFGGVQPDMATFRPITAVKCAQEGGFSGAIMPRQKQEPAGEDPEADAIKSKQALAQMMHLEVLREVFHLEHSPVYESLGCFRSWPCEDGYVV